ncbi:MAG TPA: hypothetical protein VJL86_13085 [Steroidobacteraceae bacterium]|nr:hypothetical protein [Steroidobacteraceae bacterium]
MTATNWRALACFISFLTAVPGAIADSPCYKGYRDTSPAERAKMTAVLQTVKDAMPAPPAGWVISSDDMISVPQSLCQDFGLIPIDYGFGRLYRQVGDAEQRQKLMDDQSARLVEAYKQKQPRLEAIQGKMEKLNAQQIALLQKGDVAGAEKFGPQIAALQEEYQKVADEGNDPAAMDAVSKELNRDLELTISVRVNPTTASVPTGAKPMAAPAGAKSAWRWHVEDNTQSSDHALYHFGTWFKRPDGSFQPSVRQGAPFSAAHGITLEISGDPQRVTQMISALNFPKVATALK